ncbi:hypothetical protein N2152v2_002451 [Parachlorella kessleri]
MSEAGLLPREEVRRIGGHDTEVLHIEPTSEPQLQVFVVPGNPGKAHYYVPFMQSLHELLSGRASVTAISQLGMDGHQLTPLGKVFSLEDQITHKADFLREQLLGHGRPPVVVVSHSIGTYISIHAVDRLEEELGCQETTIVKVVGLFPFLAANPDCHRQANLRRLTRLYWGLGHLATMLQLLPSSTQRWLLKLFSPDLEEHAVEATLALLNPTNVRNGLFMGRCEFETLTGPADWWLLRKLGPRFAVLCCPNDVWFPEWKWQQMLQDVPGVEAFWEESMNHAFCVTRKMSLAVAQRILEILGKTQGPGKL